MDIHEQALVKPGAREQYGVQTSIRHRHIGRTTIQNFESAPLTHTACLRHVQYSGSEIFPVAS